MSRAHKEGATSLTTKRRLSQAIARGRERAEKRRTKHGGRQPWLVRKLAVGIVVGLICYAYYVYVATFCVPMIRREDSALGSRHTGTALLVVFNVLWLVFVWNYGVVVLTPPGYAVKHVPHSGPPVPASQQAWPPTPTDTDGESIAGPPYGPTRVSEPSGDQPMRPQRTGSKEEARPTDSILAAAHVKSGNTIGGKEVSSVPTTTSSRTAPTRTSIQTQSQFQWQSQSQSQSQAQSQAQSQSQSQSQAQSQSQSQSQSQVQSQSQSYSRSQSQSNALPQPPPPAHLSGSTRSRATIPTHSLGSNPQSNNNAGSGESDLPPPVFSRRPPTHPVLAPEYRYCARDEILKPWRTHHCRACGTCILRYDHHCPWIGQCVGAHNHKFFLTFLFWSTIFTLYVLISLVIFMATHASNPSVPDPQHIVIVALSGLFSFFTFALGLTQARLILLNMTTVEQLNANRMRERENAILSDFVPCACFGLEVCWGEGVPWNCCFGDRESGDGGFRKRWEEGMPDVERIRTCFGTVRVRRDVKKQWDYEWGRLEIEGNLWWAGSTIRNWKEVMGERWWTWLLPIGKGSGDGMTFPKNPRFDDEGRWRRRRDWPEELRVRRSDNV